MSYNEKVLKEESSVIAIDFDGVIHNNSLGFHDGTIYGEPIEGSLQSIKTISKKFQIVIYTAKAKSDRPLINGKTGVELVWDWLKKYDIDNCVKEVTAEKPRCICYVDDKAIKFEDWNQTMNDIQRLVESN